MSDSRRHPKSRPAAPERAARPRSKPGWVVRLALVTGLVACAFVLIGLVGWLFLADDNAGGPANASPIPLTPQSAVVSNDGVTVVTREQTGTPSAAPVAQGADRPDGFAIELGAALSFGELSARFARIAGQNAEAEFDRLEPRATLKDTETGLEARLLVGPFGNSGAAEATCSTLALPAGINCRVVPFEGELISRQ